jgi:hypothetical protein
MSSNDWLNNPIGDHNMHDFQRSKSLFKLRIGKLKLEPVGLKADILPLKITAKCNPPLGFKSVLHPNSRLSVFNSDNKIPDL